MIYRTTLVFQGLFGNPLLADASGFYLLKQQAEIDSEQLVQEATSTKRTRNVVEIFDELSDVLCRVADLVSCTAQYGLRRTTHPTYSISCSQAECVRLLHGDSDFAQAAEEAHSSMSSLVEEWVCSRFVRNLWIIVQQQYFLQGYGCNLFRLNTNRPLYESLRKSVEKGDIKPMDEIDRHTARLFLVDFELAGIHLEETKVDHISHKWFENLSARLVLMYVSHSQRRRVVQLNARILSAGSKFLRRCYEPRYVKENQVPEEIKP